MSGVALVTGASRGIGRAIALELEHTGLRVAVNYAHDRAAAERVVDCMAKKNGKAYQCDVADEAAVADMVARIEKDLGAIRVLVNNAGVWRGGFVEQVSLQDFRNVIEISLIGARNCTAAVLPGMKRSREGKIVNISSVIGMMGWRGDTAYGAAKAALIGFTQSLAREVASFGIQANTVLLGLVDTDMTAQIPKSARDRIVQRTLLKRAASPLEVARVVRFLSTEDTYMTGSSVVVDGGLLLGRDYRPELDSELGAE